MQPLERCNIHEARYRHDDNRTKCCFRQRLKKSSESQRHDDNQSRCNNKRETGLSASAIISSRVGEGRTYTEALKKTRAHVGRSHRYEFTIRVDLMAVLFRQLAGRSDCFGEHQKAKTKSAEQKSADLAGVHIGHSWSSEPRWYLTDDRYSAILQSEDH